MHLRLVLLALALLLACGSTPTDRYYSALSTLSGTRELITSTCAAIPQPTRTELCAPLRGAFYVPTDAALEVAESARQAVESACAVPDSIGCADAGRRLEQAAAAMTSLSATGSRWLAARGVKR